MTMDTTDEPNPHLPAPVGPGWPGLDPDDPRGYPVLRLEAGVDHVRFEPGVELRLVVERPASQPGLLVGYHRALLVETVARHLQNAEGRCRCGWGYWPEHQARGHAAHVASVYELRARGALLMGTTRTGQLRHLTETGFESLCGRRLDQLTLRLDDGEPIAYASHWADDAVTFGEETCATCRLRVGDTGSGSDVLDGRREP